MTKIMAQKKAATMSGLYDERFLCYFTMTLLEVLP